MRPWAVCTKKTRILVAGLPLATSRGPERVSVSMVMVTIKLVGLEVKKMTT